ncbi:MAG: hypothetical protein CFH41_00130 [Alphaproteobacteria bacterium MarineAlpha11_Bin1]|nr:MAG: hypothetical protein CFH41_00130 [Alphaproteobacteria bacterium MarineAlpha11_Bin1]
METFEDICKVSAVGIPDSRRGPVVIACVKGRGGDIARRAAAINIH